MGNVCSSLSLDPPSLVNLHIQFITHKSEVSMSSWLLIWPLTRRLSPRRLDEPGLSSRNSGLFSYKWKVMLSWSLQTLQSAELHSKGQTPSRGNRHVATLKPVARPPPAAASSAATQPSPADDSASNGWISIDPGLFLYTSADSVGVSVVNMLLKIRRTWNDEIIRFDFPHRNVDRKMRIT